MKRSRYDVLAIVLRVLNVINMIHSRIYKTFMFTACFGAFISIAPEAIAQQKTSFFPKSQWAVEFLSGDDSSRKICRIQSEYNNGFILAFSGDSDNLNSLNVDFRQNVFDIGKNYTVQLNTNGTGAHSVSGKAFSANSLNLALDRGRDFIGAMKSANYLDANIEGNAFRFQLNGMPMAINAYENCTQTTFAQATNQSVTNIQTLPERAPEPAAQPVAMAQPTQSQSNFVFDSSMQTETLQRFDEAPRPKLSAQLYAEMNQTPVDLLPKERRYNVTGAKPVMPTMSNVTMAAPIEPVQSLPSVNTETPKVASSVFVETPAQPRPSVPVTQTRTDSQLQSTIDRLKSQLDSKVLENEQLKDELQLSLEESREETVSITSSNWDLERATMRYNEAERQVKRLGQQIQREKARCATQMKELEMLLFDPELTDKEQLAKLAELEDKLFEAEEKLSEQRRGYEERIKLLEMQLSTAQ